MKTRSFRPDHELSDFLDKHSDAGERLPVKDAIEQYYRQKLSSPAEATTTDGRYRIFEGKLQEFQSFRPGGRGAWVDVDPAAIRERASGEKWKRELAERKDRREEEKHQLELVQGKVKVRRLQEKYAPDTVFRTCPECRVQLQGWKRLNEHRRDAHGIPFVDRARLGLTFDSFGNTAGPPSLKWYGQVTG